MTRRTFIVPGTTERVVIAGVIELSCEDLRKLAQHYRIRRLVLFGSAARGTAKPDSDIDLLVEYEPEQAPSLW